MCTVEQLTPRELEIIQHVAAGRTNSEIATRLQISPRTVQGLLASAMRKTGTRSRTSLAVLAVIRELVEVHEAGRDCPCTADP